MNKSKLFKGINPPHLPLLSISLGPVGQSIAMTGTFRNRLSRRTVGNPSRSEVCKNSLAFLI